MSVEMANLRTVGGMRKDIVYKALIACTALLMGLFATRRYAPMKSVPKTGGAIIVGNHISIADPLIMAHAVSKSGRLPRSLAMAELFRIPVVGFLFRRMGHIPVRRGTVDAAQSLDKAIEALNNGELVLLYPQGGIPKEEWVGTMKTGAARMALATGAPVIPVAQWGIQKVVPPHKRLWWLRTLRSVIVRPKVKVLVGAPLSLSGNPDDPQAVREATDQIKYSLNAALAELRGIDQPAHLSGPQKK